VTVLACLLADAFWFYLGRYRGNQVLGLLCRISLEPDSCVRRTQNVFARYGLRGVFVAKFLPGLGTVVPPLAGMSGMGIARFLVVDAAGSLLYGGCLFGLGYLFSHQLEQVVAGLTRIGGSSLALIGGLVALCIAYKYWQRHRLLHELRMARISADELRQMLDSGEAPIILDLRSSAAMEADPVLIRGAIHLRMEDVERRQHEFPQDREIVMYCSCPNEVSSARVALLLRRKGFTRVRPLLGGIDAWRERNYPTETRTATVNTPVSAIVVNQESTPAGSTARPVLVVNDAAAGSTDKEREHGAAKRQG
jgi:membrane protein DedA with SNARE-associated domain/rhodanese-related sulfurtransferase